MSASRLPARPSVEQLRKQAKDLLKAYRAGDDPAVARVGAVLPRLADAEESVRVTLTDAQFVLAVEYGFENWASLMHRVEAVRPSGIGPLERLAKDIFAAYRMGDDDALQRLNDVFPRVVDLDQLRALVTERLLALPDGERRVADFRLTDAELLVAQQSGFANWDALVDSAGPPRGNSRLAPHGLSARPPFYRIDWQTRTIEVRPPLTKQDWDTIAGVITEHAITGLDAGGQMTDAGMERIARLSQLTSLNLNGSKRVTDAGLSHLVKMPQLRHLDLSGWHSPITDRGLEVLRDLRELRTFHMCWPQHVSDAGVAHLTFCDHLESVDLLGTKTGDRAVNALAGKRALRRFKSGQLVTDRGLPLFHRFPMFKTWHASETSYSLMSADAGPTHLLIDGPFTNLNSLAGLDGLFGFSLFWHVSALTSDGLGPLADLPHLGFLGCEGTLCDDEAMRHIARLPTLRMLMGQGTVASDAGFAALSRSPTIEYIWGRECPNLAGSGFVALAEMPALRGLAVSCKNVGDAALSALPRFAALKELMPMDVPDEGFRHVGRCDSLEALWCMYCRETTDEATRHISGLSRLKQYYAGKTRITDQSLEILARMPSLERLEFWETAGITDAGVALLAGLPRLRELWLSGCRAVTRDAVAMFPATVRVTYGQ